MVVRWHSASSNPLDTAAGFRRRKTPAQYPRIQMRSASRHLPTPESEESRRRKQSRSRLLGSGPKVRDGAQSTFGSTGSRSQLAFPRAPRRLRTSRLCRRCAFRPMPSQAQKHNGPSLAQIRSKLPAKSRRWSSNSVSRTKPRASICSNGGLSAKSQLSQLQPSLPNALGSRLCFRTPAQYHALAHNSSQAMAPEVEGSCGTETPSPPNLRRFCRNEPFAT